MANRILKASETYRREMTIAALTTASKRAAPTLPAADIWAYESTHYRPEEGESALTDTLRQLAARIHIQPAYIDEKLVEIAASRFTRDLARRLWKEHNLGRQKER
jgi:hypothetical protein